MAGPPAATREERVGPARRRLCRLLAQRSFRTGDFELASGGHSDYYVDCRTTTMHALGQVLIGQVGFETLREAGLAPDAIGGLTMGADPLAYAIAAESWRRGEPIHAFSVRKRAKRHGRGQLIEGCFEPGARVVIVEDVITTGGSALKASEAVRAGQGEVLAVLGLVDRDEGGRRNLEEAGLRTLVLYTAADLRRCAAESGPDGAPPGNAP